MRPTPFRQGIDVTPIPFSKEHCLAAKRLKAAGLVWHPHIGCFVWDELELIEIPSPFPHRIYFVLNLGHFARRFGTVGEMAGKLVWLPTWYQARLICESMGIDDAQVWERLCLEPVGIPGGELLVLYHLLLERLQEQGGKEVDT